MLIRPLLASYMHIVDMRRLGRPPATLLQRDLAEDGEDGMFAFMS